MNTKKYEEYKRLLEQHVSRYPERREEFALDDGTPLKTVYTQLDLPEGFYEELDLPGMYPFRRGIRPNMYRGRLWTMRQYAGFGTAKESNERYKYLLEQGQTGLSVAFDLPTQLGYDSDHPLSRGEVGKVGVAIDTIEDMRVLFDGIPLDRVSVSMTINSTANILLAMLIVVADEQGVPWSSVRGTVQNDVLKEYVARGTYIFPPGPSLMITADLIGFCARHLPKFNPISISGYHIREAGATAVQEVAFTLADGITYVEAALDKGLDIDEFAPRLSFFFAAHSNLFEEVAKFRAARELWANLMKERFGAKKERSMQLRFHTQTGGSTLTSKGVMNNVVRVAYQALAAVLGGTQSLHTNALDEALALPTEESAKLALRTQQILAYETGVADVVDPLGGSYYVEYLTNRIRDEARRLIEWIDQVGGMVKAIEEGLISKAIEDSAYQMARRIDSGDKVIVGVNRFEDPETPPEHILKVSEELEAQQRARLVAFKENRDPKRIDAVLGKVEAAARKEDGVMEAVIDAVKEGATVGEITGAIERVFGRYRPAFGQ